MHKGLPTIPLSRDRLRQGPTAYTGELELQEDFGPKGLELLGQPGISITAEESADGGVRIIGTLTGRLVETCPRCLASVERERTVSIDLRLEPGLDAWEEGPGVYVLDANQEEIDAGPALREEFLLALPDYPYCRPDCKGLCPRCGTDLNDGDCDCVETTGDPRWEALRRQIAPEGGERNDDEQDG